MFGQGTPFGSPPGQPTGFGSTGQPAFGSPPAAPFGAQPTATTNTPFGGGTFGAQPTQSGFGATTTTGGFGASAGFGTNTFGAQQQPGTSAFGGGGGFGGTAPGAFGTIAPAPTTGLFGSSAPSTGGTLFGGGAGGFGSSMSTNTFGGTNTGFGGATTAGFGASTATPSTGLFGSPAPAPAFGTSTFGASTTGGFGATGSTGGLFGSPPVPAPNPGLFGSPTANVGGGTKLAPYQATTRQDGTASIQLQAITAMQQYEGKSFEELRYEDYAQGNKGTGSGAAGGTTGGFGAFGASSTGLFGSTAPAPAPFGAPTTGGFGAAPAPAFGMPNTGAFGAPAPAPTGAFGASTTTFGAPPGGSTGLFGAPAPAPSAFGAFGSTAAKPLFGAPTPAPAPGAGLFGSTTAPAPSIFGGAPAPAPGLFGATPAPAPGGLFGSTPSFGAPTPAPAGGLFGAAPAPSTGLFGAPAPATGGLFGAPAPAFGGSSVFAPPSSASSGGLFGAKPPGTGLFGAPTPAPGGLFGAQAPAPTPGYFGQTAAPPPVAPGYFSFSSPPVNIAAPLASDVLAQQMAALENQRKELEKLDVWRGKSPEISSVVPTSLSEAEASVILPYRGYARPYSASPKSQTQIRPRGFNTLSATKSPPQLSLASHISNNRVMMTPAQMVSSSVKRLVIKPESLTPKPRLRLQFEDSPSSGLLNGRDTQASELPSITAGTSQTTMESSTEKTEDKNDRNQETNPKSPGYEYYRSVVSSPDEAGGGTTTPDSKSGDRQAPSQRLPKLTKIGYSISPSLEELSALSEADLAAVPNFTITRDGIGRVEWEGAVDIRDVDLDQVVEIDQGDIAVYVVEEQEGTKPAQGTKLNRPATITLWNIFPKEGDSLEKFIRKVKKSTAKLGAEMIAYDHETGEWIFRVLHFSRYGLFDDDSDDDVDTNEHQPGLKAVPQSPDAGETYASKDHYAYVSDVEMSDADYAGPAVMKKAATAYDALTTMMEESDDVDDKTVVSSQFFEEEIESEPMQLRTQHDILPQDYEFSVSWSGIASKMKSKAKIDSAATATDASLRLGHSFGVGWHPDGSFFRLSPAINGFRPGLVRSRPIFSNSHAADQNNHLSERLLETQLANSQKSPQSGLFSLPLGIANSGTESSQQNLRKATMEFSMQSYTRDVQSRRDDPEKYLVGHRAFELVSCLLETTEGDVSVGGGITTDASSFIDDSCRLEAVTNWIIDACEYDVEAAVELANHRNDVAAAIAAAVSGGDVEKASSIAASGGFPHLASLLTVGPSVVDDLRSQVSEWNKTGVTAKIPTSLLRVYSLLGGDLQQFDSMNNAEHESLDWRRCVALRLVFGARGASLAEIIQKFSKEVSASTVAYPVPRYLQGLDSGNDTPCTLYRILELFEKPSKCQLSSLVHPSGHSDCLHDYTLSFHLASILSAFGICHQLSNLEEARLVDSYSAQLQDKGHWEWAVFVQLCSLTTASADSPHWRLPKAKNIVLKNFNPAHPRAQEIQSFLEAKIGVPREWFDEARALKCAITGDVLGYALQAASYSMESLIQTLERIFLPNLFFMSEVTIEASMELLQTCADSGSALSEALSNFFALSKDVHRISQTSRDTIVEHLPFLIETARDIEATLVSYQANAKTLSPLTLSVYPDFRMVPMESFLAEAMAGLSLLKLQLRALEVNLPIPGVDQPTATSTVEGFTSDLSESWNESDIADEKILRGLIDEL